MKKVKALFLVVSFVLITDFSYASGSNFTFRDAPLQDVCLLVSELTRVNISGSFSSDTKLTFVASNLATHEILPAFRDALSAIGFTFVKHQYGYTVLPAKAAGSDPDNGWAVFSLRHASAEKVKDALEKALGEKSSVTVVSDYRIVLSGPTHSIRRYTALLSQIDQPAPSDFQAIPVRHARLSAILERLEAAIKESSVVLSDPWSRSILFAGPPEEFSRVSAMVEALDVPDPGIVHRLVSVHASDSDVLAETVRPLFPDLEVASHNSKLILIGHEPEVTRAAEFCAELDGSFAQVHVECVIASLTDSEFEELGIRLSALQGDYSLSLNAAGIPLLLSPGPGLLVELVSGTLAGAVAAQQSESRGQILSAPSLSCLSGQSATLTVGQQIPLIGSKTENVSGSTSFSVEREDIGVTLQIEPTIEGDFVFLKIMQEVSNIDSSARNTVDVVTAQQKIETVLKVADGQTVFLGGLKSSDETVTKENVPILSLVPLFGDLFTYKKKTKSNRNLVVSIRPTVKRPQI